MFMQICIVYSLVRNNLVDRLVHLLSPSEHDYGVVLYISSIFNFTHKRINILSLIVFVVFQTIDVARLQGE